MATTLTLNISTVATGFRETFSVYTAPSGGSSSSTMDLSAGSSGTTSHYDDIRAEGLVGTSLSWSIVGNLILSIAPVRTSFPSTFLIPAIIFFQPAPVTTSFRIYLLTAPSNKNRFWTSTIGGEVSFINTEENPEATDNVAPFEGWLYRGLKLGGSVIIYGENGVLRATPGEQLDAWGKSTVHSVGLKGMLAVCGDDNEHYFIDAQGWLGILSDKGLQMIDYTQFLSALSSKVVMTKDPRNSWIHIADGTIGFTYTPFGLGDGFPNVTGMGLQSGNLYITSDGARVSPPFHIMTDVLDSGSRGQKTVSFIQVSTDVISGMQVRLNYKTKGDTTPRQSPWYPVLPGGDAYPLVTCVEYQVEVQQPAYAKTTVDRLTIRGHHWSGGAAQ